MSLTQTLIETQKNPAKGPKKRNSPLIKSEKQFNHIDSARHKIALRCTSVVHSFKQLDFLQHNHALLEHNCALVCSWPCTS